MVSCAQTAERIEMKFGTGTWGDKSNIVLDGVSIPLFWGELGVGEFFVPMEKIGRQNFNVKYLGYGERYEVGLNGGRIGSRLWAIDWRR